MPGVAKRVDNVRTRVESAYAGYFLRLDEQWESLEAQGKTDPDGKTSLQYVDGMINFMQRDMELRATLPAHALDMTEVQRFQLSEAVLAGRAVLLDDKFTLESCEHHFHSVRRQHVARELLLQRPVAGVVDVQFDFKVTTLAGFLWASYSWK
jgi:hypothetical protein